MKLNKKLFIYFATITIFLLPHTGNNIYAMQVAQVPELNPPSIFSSDITTFSDNIEWRYKSENGVLYKRRFNLTTRQWIGNWIRC